MLLVISDKKQKIDMKNLNRKGLKSSLCPFRRYSFFSALVEFLLPSSLADTFCEQENY